MNDEEFERLINETLEDLCEKYPLNDHQSVMRASFEIFAFNLIAKRQNEFNIMMNRIVRYKNIRQGMELLNL